MTMKRILSPLARILRTAPLLLLSLIVSLDLYPTTVTAAEDPIPLIDVVVERIPPGNGKVTYPAKTDAKGMIRFKSLPEGRYVVTDAARNTKVFMHPGGPVNWLFTGTRKR